MALDTIPGKEKTRKEEVQLYMTKDGTHWYRGPDGNVVVLDDEGDAERDRQHLEPDTESVPGYPKFSERPRHAEIPPEGSTAPEEADDAEQEKKASKKSKRGGQRKAAKNAEDTPGSDAVPDTIETPNGTITRQLDATARERIGRAYLHLDPQKFEKHTTREEGRGKGDRPLSEHYTHPDDPGRVFSPAQIEAVRAAHTPKEEPRIVPPKAEELPNNPEPPKTEPPKVESNPDNPSSPEPGPKEPRVEEIHGPTSDDIPVESVDGSNFLAKGYYTNAKGEILTPEQMTERDKRLAARRKAGDANAEAEKREEERRKAREDGPKNPEPPKNAELPTVNPLPPEKRESDIIIDVNKTWNTNTPEFYGVNPDPIRQILKTKEGNIGFAEVMRRLEGRSPEAAAHADEIITKSIEGKTLTEYEENMLKYASYEYERCRRKVEFVRASMQQADLEVVTRFDERFKSMTVFNGPLRTMQIFQRELARSGMRNPELLDRLQLLYQKLAEVRKSSEYKNWEARVQGLNAETGVPMQHFGQVFGGLNPEKQAEVQRELQKKYYEKKGTVGRIFDGFFGSSRRDAERTVHSAINAVRRSGAHAAPDEVRDYGNAMRELSSVMKEVLGQEQVAQSYQQEAFQDQDLEPSTDGGPLTFKDGTKAQGELQKTFDKELTGLLKQKVNGKDFDHMSLDERMDHLEPLNTRFESEFKPRRRGWFARAFQSIFSRLFADKVATALNRPVKA